MNRAKLDSQLISIDDLLFLIDKLRTQKEENRGIDVTGLYAGQMVWVKNGAGIWCYGKYVGRKLNKIGVVFGEDRGTLYYSEYSILNPYPESIEAKSIQTMREVLRGKLPAEAVNKLMEFLQEISSYK